MAARTKSSHALEYVTLCSAGLCRQSKVRVTVSARSLPEEEARQVADARILADHPAPTSQASRATRGFLLERGKEGGITERASLDVSDDARSVRSRDSSGIILGWHPSLSLVSREPRKSRHSAS